MSETETIFNFEAWSAGYEARKAFMRKLMFAALTEGNVIHETWESVSGKHHAAWKLGRNVFIEPWASDAGYIADHLSSRHFGFGFEMTVAGTTYSLGNASV